MSLFNNEELIVKNIINICSNRYDEYFFAYPNVVGFGFGQKIVQGQETGVPCFTFLVEKKILESQLAKSDIITSEIDGIKTDVVESGKIENLALKCSCNQCFCDNRKRYRYEGKPIIGGMPIGIKGGIKTGTLSCVVSRGYYVYLLSNNHVIANFNTAAICAPVYGSRYECGGFLRRPIARLSEFKEILFKEDNTNNVNKIDAAIACVGRCNDPRVWKLVRKGIYLLGPICGINNKIAIGDNIKKVGFGSLYTSGKIVNTNLLVKVISPINNKEAIYVNQIAAKNISAEGDSGSLGLDEYNRAFGLLFSGKELSIYNPIQEVLSNFNIKIL